MRRHRRVIPAQELIARAKNRRPTMPHIGRDWFYVITKQFKENGRQVLLGPYNDAREAEEIALEKCTTDYTIASLPTRDLAMATRMIKHNILRGNGGNLDTALRRMKHTI